LDSLLENVSLRLRFPFCSAVTYIPDKLAVIIGIDGRSDKVCAWRKVYQRALDRGRKAAFAAVVSRGYGGVDSCGIVVNTVALGASSKLRIGNISPDLEWSVDRLR
jgi:hypothetical protein